MFNKIAAIKLKTFKEYKNNLFSVLARLSLIQYLNWSYLSCFWVRLPEYVYSTLGISAGKHIHHEEKRVYNYGCDITIMTIFGPQL